MTKNVTRKQFGFTKSGGFTMIELLVVATIMILLTTIGLVSFQNTSRNARNGKRKADLESVRSALVIYRSDNGTYPVAGGQTLGNFDAVVTTLFNADYYSNPSLDDPKEDATYFYSYSSDGTDFNLCATLESDTPNYCLTNP